MDSIGEMAQAAAREHAAAMDRYLIEAFGSEENVRRFASDYVLEEYPLKSHLDGDKITFTQSVRLKRKDEDTPPLA